MRLHSHSRTAGPLLVRPRRGAMVVLVGILLVAMVGLFALAVDFGRLDNLKSDLQTTADAAALAGAVELIPVGPHNPTQAANVATTWVTKNPAMQATASLVSVDCGTWNDLGPTFLATACTPSVTNAVRVTVSRQSSGLFMSALGVTAPVIFATATASVRPDLVFPPFGSCLPSNCRVYLVPNR